jgi:hypothetical protein
MKSSRFEETDQFCAVDFEVKDSYSALIFEKDIHVQQAILKQKVVSENDYELLREKLKLIDFGEKSYNINHFNFFHYYLIKFN